MARISPEAFPDRFALDAYARRCRVQELDRLLGTAARWLKRQQRSAVSRAAGAGAFAAARSAPHAAR